MNATAIFPSRRRGEAPPRRSSFDPERPELQAQALGEMGVAERLRMHPRVGKPLFCAIREPSHTT